MFFYRHIICPALNRLDSETMHDAAREALHFAEATPLTRALLQYLTVGRVPFSSPLLRVNAGGLSFENPVLVAAGWDKQARAVHGLHLLGFGGVEVGSVLERPQPGNPKPRQFMIGPGVALNALGFNSKGMEAVAHNLLRYRGLGIPIGINIGKNKEVPLEDAPRAYAVVADRLYDDAKYFVVNVSSPNTPGLRTLQDRGHLTEILAAVREAVERRGGNRPTFVKIAPELTLEAVDDVIAVALEQNLTGIIAINTSNNPDTKARYGEKWREQPGGVSGDDEIYRANGVEKIRHMYRQTKGSLVLIGVGGIRDASTALERIRAGASLVQVLTAIRGEGPAVAQQINRGLAAWMTKHGIRSLQEVVGSEGRELPPL